MAHPLHRHHTAAVIAKLATSGKLVGDAQAPPGADPEVGYFTVYPITGGATGGTLAGPQDDAELIYQVTCTGSTRQQVEWLVDKARELLLAGIAVAGRKLPRIREEQNPGVFRDDQQTPPVFWSPAQFRLYTTPA